MKKKVIAVALYIALLMTSVFPATALAENEAAGGTEPETQVCICESKCSEGNVNADCPVCSAAVDLSACQGQEPQPMNEQAGGDTTPADGQGGTEGTAPVCTCTTKCAEGAGNPDCPICGAEGADLSACAGQAAEGGEDENDGTPAPAPSPVCTCTAKCSEGAINAACPVCAADWSSCAFTGENGEPEEDSKPETVTVTDWSWMDDMKALATDGKLYLLSAVTAESLEEIIALLPRYILAGEEQIALRWTYDEATGIFTAALPEGYALAEWAKPLTVETVVMGADTLDEKTIKYIDATGAEQTVTATSVTANETEWSDSTTGGWYVAEGNVTIESRVKVSGAVNLILADGCTLTVKGGIEVNEGNSFTIYAQSGGTGALSATGSGYAAGIGGGTGQNCGTVTIKGGSVNATGGNYGAGIGGGYKGNDGSINIENGDVTATSGDYGAGIGGGYQGNGGSITIKGGSVEATGGGAGIGGGDGGDGGSITISGGSVTATGGGGSNILGDPASGAGIGGGEGGEGGSITISGGSVTATGSGYAAGIGGSSGTFSTGDSGRALIYATGGNGAAAISDDDDKSGWSGIIFEGDAGAVYGNQTNSGNLTIATGQTLDILSGSTFTNEGTLTNEG